MKNQDFVNSTGPVARLSSVFGRAYQHCFPYTGSPGNPWSYAETLGQYALYLEECVDALGGAAKLEQMMEESLSVDRREALIEELWGQDD